MKGITAACILILLCTGACTIQVKQDDKKQTEAASSKIKNGIEIQEKGLHAEQAFLLFDDDKRVPDDNTIEVNQRVTLRLIVNNWKEDNGKVFLGASEKIETSDGDVIVDQPDLFAAYTDGVSKTDAQFLSLYAKITKLDKLYDYFTVKFRVWNKKSNEEFSGSYKLYIK